MAHKTLIRPDSNPPIPATVTSLPVPEAFAAEVEFRRLSEGADRALFVQRFADEMRRCKKAEAELRVPNRKAKRHGLAVKAGGMFICLSLQVHLNDLKDFDDATDSWDEHAIDCCRDLVKARAEFALEPGPLRAPKPVTSNAPHEWPPVAVRPLTPQERAGARRRATEALTQYVAAEEQELASLRAMLDAANAGDDELADDRAWDDGLALIDKAIHCAGCGEVHEAHEAMVEDLRAMSGRLVYASGGSYITSGKFAKVPIEWARTMIGEHGADNEAAQSIVRASG